MLDILLTLYQTFTLIIWTKKSRYYEQQSNVTPWGITQNSHTGTKFEKFIF